LTGEEKLSLLDRLEAGLLGECAPSDEAIRLRQVLNERNLQPRHAQDLLQAFRMDVGKLRYSDWNELMTYCSYSAMPVGRFVLDVHGESRDTWHPSDSLCAALQIINHLQDCGEDYRRLDRVYIPLDALARAGTSVDALSQVKSSAALRRCLDEMIQGIRKLLHQAEPLPMLVKDFRLTLEISVIHRLAYALADRLSKHDPLSERPHLNALSIAGLSMTAIAWGLSRRAAAIAVGKQPKIVG
jgi:squalene synthase HpnC